MSNTKAEASKYVDKLEESVRACEALRKNKDESIDISLSEYMLGKYQISMAELYADLGINPSVDTIQNLVNMPSASYRWLIPEIYREALRLGLRKSPIYPSIIAGEQGVGQTTITMPAINMSDAVPHRVGMGETIPIGNVSFDQKSVSIYKIGRGFKLPYEVKDYVALNLVSIYLQDFGVKLAMGLDSLMITTLLNGDQKDGSDSIATVGVANTTDGLTYKDLLKIWVRGARLGKKFTSMIAGEAMAIDILDLLTTTRVFGTARANVNMKTPIPQNSDLFIHGNVATDKVIIIDSADTIIKLNAQPLLVETEKIISNQTEETYATLTTGFATIFRDSRIVLDRTVTTDFPTWMDPSTEENVIFK
jgi:hypothetical protein